MPLGVPFGRFRTQLSAIRIRRFQDAQTEILDATQPLAQRQLAAFAQSPIPEPPSLENLALGFSGGPQLGPISPTQTFEAPQQQLARGTENLREFGRSIQGLDPSSLEQLRDLAGFSMRQGTTPQQVVQQAEAPSVPQGAPPAPTPEPVTDDIGAAIQRVLEVNKLSQEEYGALSSEQRILAIGQVLQEPFPGVSNSALQQLVAQEREAGGNLATLAGRTAVGAGRFALETLEEERKFIQPRLRPGLEFAGEQIAETVTGVPGGRVLRAAGVPVPEAPGREEAGAVTAAVGGEVLLPSNLIPLPFIDPLVGRIIGGAFKTGQKVTRSVLTRLGRQAAEQATDEALGAPTQAALREFVEATQGAAPDLPTGLPSTADVVAPTGAAPARGVPGGLTEADLALRIPNRLTEGRKVTVRGVGEGRVATDQTIPGEVQVRMDADGSVRTVPRRDAIAVTPQVPTGPSVPAAPTQRITQRLSFDDFETEYRAAFSRNDIQALSELSDMQPKWAEVIENKPQGEGPFRAGSPDADANTQYVIARDNARGRFSGQPRFVEPAPARAAEPGAQAAVPSRAPVEVPQARPAAGPIAADVSDRNIRQAVIVDRELTRRGEAAVVEARRLREQAEALRGRASAKTAVTRLRRIQQIGEFETQAKEAAERGREAVKQRFSEIGDVERSILDSLKRGERLDEFPAAARELNEPGLGRAVEPGAAPAVRQAAPAPPAPTVKTRTLFGEEVDTFATERELGGIREQQGGLPLEERPPARELPDLFGRTERDVAEELRIVNEDLAGPRLQAGVRIEFRARQLELQEEQRILRLVRESPDTDVLLEGLERELEDVSFDLSRKGVPFGGRAGVSVGQARKQRLKGRGTTIARTGLETPQLQARAAALEDWIPRLREQVAPAPAAGGAPLTRAQLRERSAAGTAQQAVQQGVPSQPERDAREAWRLFDGANKEGALHRATWREDTYELFEQSGIEIARRSDDQADQVVEIMERMFHGGEQRAPIGQFRPGERSAVQALYTKFDEATARLIQADPDFEMRALPEYFAHQFKVSKPKRGAGARGLQLRPGFLRKRQLKGALGEILGKRPDLDLVTWDPVAYVERHVAAVDNYINSLEMIRGLKAKGLIAPRGGGPKLSDVVAKTKHGDLGSLTGRRVVAADRDNIGRVLSVSSDGTSASVHFRNKQTGLEATKTLPTSQLSILEAATGAVREGAPAAWRTPNNVSPFKVRQALDGWVAEPKVALALEQMFGTSMLDQFGALRLLKNVRETAFRAKVFGGAFQAIDYAFRDAGLGLSELARLRPGAAVRAWVSPIKATTRAVTPGLDRRLTRLAGDNKKLSLLYRNGLAAGVDPSISDEAIRGVGKIVPDTVRGRRIPGGRGLQQVLDFMGGGAYEKFHKETLEQAGLVILEKQLKKGVPLEEAGRLAVEETNVFFSSIPNWQSAVRSKTGRDLLKFPFFATGELEGWFRLPFQAPAGFAGIIGATVIMAEMMQKLFTGDWLSLDQLNPYEVRGEATSFREKLPIIGKGGFNATFLRPELPWRGPDGRRLYLDLLGQSDTPFRWALDPEFATMTRLGQFPRLAIDLADVAHGEAPMFGERVESVSDALRFGVQQVSPIAVSGLAGTEPSRIGAVGAGIQTTGLNVLAESKRSVLARRFEEKFDRPFNPETDFGVARQDPDLAHLVGRSEGAQQRDDLLAQEEQRLLPVAQAVLAGNEEAGSQFRRERSDFLTFAAGAAAQAFYGTQFPDPKTPEGRILAEFHDLAPEDFRDPETLEPDYPQFDAARERLLAQLPTEVQQAIKSKMAFTLPEMQEVERLYRVARDLLDEAPSRVNGLTSDQHQMITDFMQTVWEARRTWLGQRGITYEDLPLEEAVAIVGQFQERDTAFMRWAQALRSGIPGDLRSIDYDRFLIEHEAELRAFFPEFYQSQRVLQQLFESNRQPVAAGVR